MSEKKYTPKKESSHPSFDLQYDDDPEYKNIPFQEKKFNLTAKFTRLNKENIDLKREKEALTKELQTLRNNFTDMVPGFNTNTSISFPMMTELQIKINDYIKLLCQDIFFDLLQPELTIKGVIKFYGTILNKCNKDIEDYFSPLINQIKITLSINVLWSPIENVLKKAYQTNWKEILDFLKKKYKYETFSSNLQKELGLLENNEEEYFQMILDFVNKTFEICFFCYIAEPQITMDLRQIGVEIFFNGTTHDAIDGFIKPKQKCQIVLPAFYKGKEFKRDSLLVKSQVLTSDYAFK